MPSSCLRAQLSVSLAINIVSFIADSFIYRWVSFLPYMCHTVLFVGETPQVDKLVKIFVWKENTCKCMHRFKEMQKEESLLNECCKRNVLMWMSGHEIEIPYHSFWCNISYRLVEQWIL